MNPRNPNYRRVAYALALLVVLGCVYLLLRGRMMDAAVLGAFVIFSTAFGLWRDKVPALFTLLFTIVATINAAGYVFDLWQQPVWFDEAVHVVTPSALVGALAWELIQRDMVEPWRNGWRYFLKVLALGLLIGFAWEGFEYVAGLIGSKSDTMKDLAMDTIGAALAALFCVWQARREPPSA